MKTQSSYFTVSAAALIALSSVLYIACDDSSAVKESPNTDAGSSSSGGSSGTSGDGGSSSSGDGGFTDCVENPTTHLEIINACTTAQRITKNPTLTKLLPDGGLPPVQ